MILLISLHIPILNHKVTLNSKRQIRHQIERQVMRHSTQLSFSPCWIVRNCWSYPNSSRMCLWCLECRKEDSWGGDRESLWKGLQKTSQNQSVILDSLGNRISFCRVHFFKNPHDALFCNPFAFSVDIFQTSVSYSILVEIWNLGLIQDCISSFL